MSHEEVSSASDDDLQATSGLDSEDTKVPISVKDMILRFEKTAMKSGDSSESLYRSSFTSVVNPITVPIHHTLNTVDRSIDRHSNVSVNSILSNTSEMSLESSSSGFVSDRRPDILTPHRPAPPPPAPFNDSSSVESKSPTPEEEVTLRERKYSFTTPNSSPVVLRRSRQPPVMRKKSSVSHQGQIGGDTLWSYGVRQSDLEKLLRLKSSEISDTEEEHGKYDNTLVISENDSSSENSSCSEGQDYILNNEDTDGRTDTLSTDHSTSTLINEDDCEADNMSGDRSNYDNVSIKSISSFDMVPYQKYDSITVSSDEYGSEVCHAPDTEFLTVSAVNEYCVSKASKTIPVESKKDKYQRRLTERVNELLHTEAVYVDRLRHVVEDYIPEMNNEDLSNSLKGLKQDIFANIERIHRFHSEEFLPALRDCENDLRKLGQCFRRFEQRFNMYVMYSRNNKRATRLVFENKHFFQKRQLELGDRLDLSSYLLEPVQRIPRYKLFLDDLVKTYTNYENEESDTKSRSRLSVDSDRLSRLSADSDGSSRLSVASDETGGSNGEPSSDETPLESLKLAKTTVESILTAIDDIMALENIRDCPPYLNLLNQGRLLRQNEFVAMDPSKKRQLLRIFLFDKLVLITAVYRKQLTVEYFIYKDHILVDDLGITAKEHDQTKFTLWYKERTLKPYKMQTRDIAIRNGWVDEITTLLWDQYKRKKDLLMEQVKLQKQRNSVVSNTSQDSAEDSSPDKYNSLRGVPGEVRRIGGRTFRRTTWYCE